MLIIPKHKVADAPLCFLIHFSDFNIPDLFRAEAHAATAHKPDMPDFSIGYSGGDGKASETRQAFAGILHIAFLCAPDIKKHLCIISDGFKIIVFGRVEKSL